MGSWRSARIRRAIRAFGPSAIRVAIGPKSVGTYDQAGAVLPLPKSRAHLKIPRGAGRPRTPKFATSIRSFGYLTTEYPFSLAEGGSAGRQSFALTLETKRARRHPALTGVWFMPSVRFEPCRRASASDEIFDTQVRKHGPTGRAPVCYTGGVGNGRPMRVRVPLLPLTEGTPYWLGSGLERRRVLQGAPGSSTLPLSARVTIP